LISGVTISSNSLKEAMSILRKCFNPCGSSADNHIYLRQFGYNLRNENNTIHPPFSRTSSFYDSFIPFTIRLWNILPLTITESPSINIFKNRLKHFYKTLDTNAFYNCGIRKFNIIHCQLRNEASNLNALLFKDFLSDNTDSANCRGPLEDNNHFLFICLKYNNLRLVFIRFHTDINTKK
jgi:hypothetical protein